MCKWYCTSSGPSTNLECLHCHAHYCGACLHGDAGKMASLVQCARCGQKPRVIRQNERSNWKAVSVEESAFQMVAPSVDGSESTLGLRKDMPSPVVAAPRDPIQLQSCEAKDDLDEHEVTQRLQRIFDYYCRLVPQASSLDNVKWMKALSDLGLLNESNVTRQDADLIFIQVKEQGSRRLDFRLFVAAMRVVARRFYPADGPNAVGDPLAVLFGTHLRDIEAFGPAKQPHQKAQHNCEKEIFGRLTDSSKYTGTHKFRFDTLQARNARFVPKDNARAATRMSVYAWGLKPA